MENNQTPMRDAIFVLWDPSQKNVETIFVQEIGPGFSRYIDSATILEKYTSVADHILNTISPGLDNNQTTMRDVIFVFWNSSTKIIEIIFAQEVHPDS